MPAMKYTVQSIINPENQNLPAMLTVHTKIPHRNNKQAHRSKTAFWRNFISHKRLITNNQQLEIRIYVCDIEAEYYQLLVLSVCMTVHNQTLECQKQEWFRYYDFQKVSKNSLLKRNYAC